MKRRDDAARWAREHDEGIGFTDIARREGLSMETVRSAVRYWTQKETGRLDDSPEVTYTNKRPDDLTLEEFIELTERTQNALESVDPLFVTETISINADKPIGVIFVSCSHLGSRYVNHREFRNLLDRVLDIPRLYWAGFGDDVEGFINFVDVGSTHEQALTDPKLQRKMLALVLDKLAAKGRLICGFASQHGGDWERKRRAADPIKQMYLDRGIRYFDGQAYIKLRVGPEMYRIFGGHQMPGSSMYNRVHAQKRAALWKAPNADVVVQGDKHVYACQVESIDTYEYLAGERPSYLRWLVQIGSAKTGLDPYTIKSWSPAAWVWPTLLFRPDRHEIAQASDLDLAELMLREW